MAGALLYAAKEYQALELAAAAKLLQDQVYALTINNHDLAEKLSESGLQVCSVNHTDLNSADTANMAAAIQQVCEQLDLDTVLLFSDRVGKELSGRVAERIGAGCLTDIKGFNHEGGTWFFERNALGGATVAACSVKTSCKVLAVAPRTFAPVAKTSGGSVQPVEVNVPPATVRLIEVQNKAGDQVDIQGAERLVIVGQGLENQSDLAIVQKIAAALGAELACSKPVATDKKWFPEDRIVGLSGKICKPALALILGVSGQVQFTVGVREAQVIVTVNNDENAYMNKISDYVLVADLKDVLPALANAVKSE